MGWNYESDPRLDDIESLGSTFPRFYFILFYFLKFYMPQHNFGLELTSTWDP